MLGNIYKNIFYCKSLSKQFRKTFLRAVHENINTLPQQKVQDNSVFSHENSESKTSTSLSDNLKDNTSLIPTEAVDSKSKYAPGIFANYVKKSETLQELFRLGVDLHRVENNSEAVHFILTSTFEDFRNHIIFLKDLGVNDLGRVISKNPLILKEDLDDLQVRVNYLKHKKFSDISIARIVETSVFWLSHSTQQIDERLGFFQKQFGLSGNEVRQLATTNPKLITFSLDKIRLNTFAFKEEMGFTSEELKLILLRKPRLLMLNQDKVLKTFECVHKTMKIPLERIVQEPEILTCRPRRLKERHLFLEKVHRAQYNPKQPNYVSLKSLITGTDAEFSIELAKTSVEVFNTFLKTL